MKKLLFSLLIIILSTSCSSEKKQLDISGEWTVRLDSTDVGIKESWQGNLFETPMQLPGTTDDAGLGTLNALEPALSKPQLLYLTRLHNYVGVAWYSREISVPAQWNDKELFLDLERALWDTQVWVDNKKVEGHEESLSTPHRYNLTPYMTCGKKHILTIRVDNCKRYDISNGMAHAYTDHTQIKWNGILGDMTVRAMEKIRLESIQLYPDVKNKQVKAVISFSNNTPAAEHALLSMKVSAKNGSQQLEEQVKKMDVKAGASSVELLYNMGDNPILWNEFTPEMYQATVTLEANGRVSEIKEDFGMRQLETNGDKMLMNNKPLFLRGTLECCIFPLTGTPPMNKEGWQKVYAAAKEYGLNHLRFHSWCPPEAAFEAADEMGFYLQVELPAWVLTIGQDSSAVRFLREEADRIIKNYGNHPSFCLWSLGNELQGDFTILSAMLDELKAKDNRHLYVTTSFTFEGGHGGWPESNDDFFVTQWTNKGWVRGQGVFNQLSPTFDKDYSESVAGIQVPLITHEIGQYSVYPDLTEISKYTGVLKPLNFMAVKNDLEKKKLLDKAPDYLIASGKLAAILYKEEIERALKTDGISGFQLLDLHDFPGQGTALVGLLNAFWESKGIIDGKAFREFCSPVVPLLRFPKAVYKNDEMFQAKIELCNYGNDILTNKTLHWDILDKGRSVKHGEIQVGELKFGYNGKLGEISVPLTDIQNASKLEVCVKVIGTDYVNRWNIWVYPEGEKVEWGNVKYTRNYDQAMAWLNEGQKVLFNPDWKKMKGIEGKFVPVFWSPVHFPNQAGTMGVLCNPAHKALADFPTDMHTDWQWWDLNKNSKTMITDSIQGGTPIVEMVDNFTNNRRLASLYEGKVHGGKLVLATFDLQSDLENRPVAKQMLVSLLKYMNSTDFDPTIIENFEEIKDMFDRNSKQPV
ncbi:glycoside hydrolase family 2 [Bacteroides fragilis]|uniref:sugar-binding domain-containing protein n=1 Tax=Bacteroides fragilis TaxID=817 RepID=UPI00202EB30C|nr:sugar-binding domain-containing protein [Bacteroides fragilis]MCM0324830.1 glycoside hydrolase family 2 [Bacteroides fragilis]